MRANDRAAGGPTVTITFTAAVSKRAQTHSLPVTARWDNLALIGSANSSDRTSSACTSSTEPWPSAAACNAMLTTIIKAPHRHRWLRSSVANNSRWPTDAVIRCVARCSSTSPIATQSAAPSASSAAISVLAIGGSAVEAGRGDE